ncbi:uncharacterized protein LOC118277015 isoform X5 [Spodoptera frugiperda]|uniref:Uncharacterized protein LOC118277015 isoform X5 n=1 Tax=Spodoptera frugiperda TaxID=7108 RepID=A0A9R0DFP3_SPOFR|nr:uncharacterized protein LOC118277015 isoform X5 [Spodoptera frugiperda]
MSHTSERSSKLQVESAKIPVPSVSVSNLNIKDLCTKRSSIKGRITKYKNYLNTFFDPSKTFSSTDISILNQRFQRFEELCTTFDDIQSEIELFNSSNLDSELDIRDEMELDFSTLIARTRVFLDANQPHENNFSSAHSESNSCQHSNDNHVGFKLPVIKINNFNGTYFKWLEFRDTFMSLIHNNNKIEDVHKFHYLNSYLEGEAALVISNLEVSSANYKEAWHLLCERYNNEDQLIDYHFDSLLNFQNAPRESSKALKFIIDHVSKNLRALNTLGEPIAHWDSLIIRLVLAKLDNSSKFKWQEHRKVLNAKPSLKDFFQFLKNRADIIESVRVNKVEHHSNNSSNSKPEKSHAKAFAVSAAPGSSAAACVFCGGSHRIYDCSTFLAKSVEDRKTEAVRLKLCINCLRKGHSSRQCSPDDLQTLTPGHFLIGRPLMSLPSPSFSTSESHGPIRDRYKHLEVLRQHFWNRWQLEYIAELQQRVKWRIPDRQLQIGELVLIKEENTPPMNWKLGRILTLYPGKDNVARVADVKTTTGTYRRAIKNLCPLLEPSENLIGADASKAPQDVAASKRNN